MFPYLIAGAIGFVVAKLFEEDEAPKYADGGLIAPNGKPSNLTPEQYTLVRTPAFKKWFGDWQNDPANASKVVDKNGEPLVKWRGDDNPKNVFDYINYDGHGVYYFGDKMFAESFGDKLNSYFINSKNPFIPNKLTKIEEKEIRNLLKRDANEILTERIENGGFDNLYNFLDNYYLIEAGFNENSNSLDILLYQFKNGINYFILQLRPIIEWLKNNDYDGYESYEGNNDNIAVFNSNQIKLADGTNTTFDGNNADIRYAGGGKVKKVKFDIEQDEDFSKQFINNLVDDIINNTDALEQGAWIDYDETRSKSIQRVKKFIKNIFNTDFNNGGLKNIPNTFTLYRVVFLDDENKLNANFLGKHWVRNEKLIKDHISPIMSQFNMTDEEYGYIITAQFKKDDIDIYNTIYNNVSVDHEEEVTIKNGNNPINHKIKKL